MALLQGHSITIGLFPVDDSLPFEDFVVGVGIAEMNIGPEHRGVDVTPHHLLDDRLRITQLDKMCDPGVSEEVESDVFRDASAGYNLLNLFQHCRIL